MFTSFYNAVAGASAHQLRLDTVANNMANANTEGYKSQSASFVDLLYTNMKAPVGEQTRLKSGSGVRVEKTDIYFGQGGSTETYDPLNFLIEGDGFFALANPETGEISYTRSGTFSKSLQLNGDFYLVSSNGDHVLSADGNPIVIESADDKIEPAVYTFENKEGMLLKGNTSYIPVEKNGEPILLESPSIKRGFIEGSNVELSKEMTTIIETQRAFQLSLKMLQTSDEITQNINNLR